MTQAAAPGFSKFELIMLCINGCWL